MPTIHLTTFVEAPIERVFDLSRNTSVIKAFLQNRKEVIQVSAGDVLVDSGDTISYQAKHFGKTRIVTTRIADIHRPLSFNEEQVKGDLKSFRHQHHFKEANNGTFVIDIIDYEAPRDLIGGWLARWSMKEYLEHFVQQRNAMVRQYAESEKWRAVLS